MTLENEMYALLEVRRIVLNYLEQTSFDGNTTMDPDKLLNTAERKGGILLFDTLKRVLDGTGLERFNIEELLELREFLSDEREKKLLKFLDNFLDKIS